MPMTPFGTDAQLKRYMSEFGVTSWEDHNQDGIADDYVLDDCKTYAMGFLVGRLARRYSYAILLTVPMMAEVYCVVCLRELCLRRGNLPPESLEFKYQEFTQEKGTLDQIVDGRLMLVDANGNLVQMRNSRAPAHSNVQVDRRFGERRIRVTTGSSNLSPTKMRRSVDVNPEFDL